MSDEIRLALLAILGILFVAVLVRPAPRAGAADALTVTAPALGQWHTLRVAAVGDRIQGYLDGSLLIDHRDKRYRAGRVGLWTKADSVTAFDDLVVRGVAP